jgi:hypothetical protein
MLVFAQFSLADDVKKDDVKKPEPIPAPSATAPTWADFFKRLFVKPYPSGGAYPGGPYQYPNGYPKSPGQFPYEGNGYGQFPYPGREKADQAAPKEAKKMPNADGETPPSKPTEIKPVVPKKPGGIVIPPEKMPYAEPELIPAPKVVEERKKEDHAPELIPAPKVVEEKKGDHGPELIPAPKVEARKKDDGREGQVIKGDVATLNTLLGKRRTRAQELRDIQLSMTRVGELNGKLEDKKTLTADEKKQLKNELSTLADNGVNWLSDKLRKKSMSKKERLAILMNLETSFDKEFKIALKKMNGDAQANKGQINPHLRNSVYLYAYMREMVRSGMVIEGAKNVAPPTTAVGPQAREEGIKAYSAWLHGLVD